MGLNCRRGHDVPKYKILFVHASFVLATFVLISNISAVTDPILAKLQSQLSGTIFNIWGDFLSGKIFLLKMTKLGF